MNNIEVDPYDLSDGQVEEIDAILAEERTAARDALAEALGWDWEPGHGVPSVSSTADNVLDALALSGWVLVPVEVDTCARCGGTGPDCGSHSAETKQGDES